MKKEEPKGENQEELKETDAVKEVEMKDEKAKETGEPTVAD